MKFNEKKFLKTKFQPRIEAVPVPDLRQWFDDLPDDQVPAWVVRGLDGYELGRANEAAQRNRNVAAMLEGLLSRDSAGVVASMRELAGLSDRTPDDIAKRLELLVLGSVDPPGEMQLAIRLCTNFPVEFFQLTTKITQLTGQGRLPGEPKGSGGIPPSERA